MTKEALVQNITDKIKVQNVEVMRIYGVPMGVGYDMLVWLNNDSYIEMHASNRAWEMSGHLRPNQIGYNNYKGSDTHPERYISKITEYFINGNGFKNYLRRFKKDQLIKWNERA
jgi:hypothetical protein